MEEIKKFEQYSSESNDINLTYDEAFEKYINGKKVIGQYNDTH
jgi:hypothetical protein